MENTKIMIGRHCMEQSEIVLSLCSKYTLFTIDLVSAQSQIFYPACVQSIEFSPNEMLQFCSFFSENANLQKLGFIESSLLFVAIRRGIIVAVTDNIMENVCKEMEIETYKIENSGPNRLQKGESEKNMKSSRTSRLSDFIRAACL